MSLESALAALTPATPTTTPVESAPKQAVSSATPAEPNNTTAPVENVSSKFAQIARQEREFAKQKQEFAKQQADLKEKMAKLEQFESRKKNAKANPMDFLKEAELSYEDIVRYQLNAPEEKPIDPIQSVRNEFEEFKKSLQTKETERLESEKAAQEAQYQEAIDTFKGDIATHLDTNKTDYELIGVFAQEGLVFQTVEEYFEQTGKVLSVKEASDMVEKHLEEQASKLLSVGKIKNKFQTPETIAQGAEPRMQQRKEPSKTLTNQVTPTHASLFGASAAKTEQERLNKALAKLG